MNKWKIIFQSMCCIVILIYLIAVSGCAGNLTRMSSGLTGCPIDSITIEDISPGFGTSTWTAKCQGMTFYCSSYSEAGKSCTKAQKPTSKEMNGASAGNKQQAANENLPVSYLTVTSNTNIRAAENTKSKIITTVRTGEKVEKIDESDKLFKVKTSKGTSGWILKSTVKE